MYLAYDIKGIQKYIFAVPRLKYIIGGSLIIADFDKRTVAEEIKKAGLSPEARIYSGGGRGLIEIDDNKQECAQTLLKALIEAAHGDGLSIRIGINKEKTPAPEDLELYPYVPESYKEFHLCQESGLYPVEREGQTHKLIQTRKDIIKKDLPKKGCDFETNILDEVRKLMSPEDCTAIQSVRFFRNVDAQDIDKDDPLSEVYASVNALGNRNRWAIVYMDGNDMGRQLKALPANFDAIQKAKWMSKFSFYLDKCTCSAFYKALANTISSWLKDNAQELREYTYYDTKTGEQTLILPFRPLVLGGDDVAMICHSAYAMQFVKQMSASFTETSKDMAEAYAKENAGRHLWPATGNSLTISAGILYCKTKFPLPKAMEYAESLLSSAKGAFRSLSGDEPTPPAVDFDTITDSLVDSPAQRRQRELEFIDGELGGTKVFLTRRPYLLQDKSQVKTENAKNALTINELETDYMDVLKGDLKNSGRSLILPGLRQAWSLRTIFLASLAKNHPELKKLLQEDSRNGDSGDWWLDEPASGTTPQRRRTAVIDALLLLDEQTRRMNQNTNE